MAIQSEKIKGIVGRAEAAPGDVLLQTAAAYGLDSEGFEHEAVRFYDAAWKLGVPAAGRTRFLVGYGSTLRNVGRLADSIELLRDATAEHPQYPALAAFLALSLADDGRPREGVHVLLGALLVASSGTSVLDGYERALGEYLTLFGETLGR